MSGSDRVRWWKQLILFDFVIWLDDGHIFVFVLLLIFVADKCEEDDEWFAILQLANWIVDLILKCCEWFDWMSFGDGVNDAVVVMGNESALWCDTINAFDATTEKQFAATAAINERKKKKKRTKQIEKKRKTKTKNWQQQNKWEKKKLSTKVEWKPEFDKEHFKWWLYLFVCCFFFNDVLMLLIS